MDYIIKVTMVDSQVSGGRRNNGSVRLQRGQNDSPSELPGAQVSLHSERLLPVQRETMRQARWRMCQHGRIHFSRSSAISYFSLINK